MFIIFGNANSASLQQLTSKPFCANKTFLHDSCANVTALFGFLFLGCTLDSGLSAVYTRYMSVIQTCMLSVSNIGWRYLQCDLLWACRICCSRRVDCRFVLNLTNFQFVNVIVSGMDYLFSIIKDQPLKYCDVFMSSLCNIKLNWLAVISPNFESSTSTFFHLGFR